MTEPAPLEVPPPPPDRGHRPPPLNQIVVGSLLVVVGGLWLLQAAAGVDFRWDVLFSLALLVVGGALVAGARTGVHGGLIALGVIVTLVLAVGSSLGGLADIPLRGGIGERVESPASLEGGEAFRLAIGELEVDLRSATVPAAGGDIEASVAIGRLVVRLPEGVGARVEASAGAGSVRALGRSSEGVDVDVTVEDGGRPVLVVRARVGLGEVVVER